MLKVEFARYRNILCTTILEQGEEIERGNFEFKHDRYVLRSNLNPAIGDKCLYLRGTNMRRDNATLYNQYDTEEEAKEAMQGFKAAIEAYNATLMPEEPEEKAPDFEVVIAG